MEPLQWFQRQAKKASSRTVQGEIELVLRELGWTDRAILAAGRTDRGVHASGQVISFDLDWKHTPDDLRAALNARLPEDVAALSVKEVAPRFHPRYDAVGRRYRYRIYSLDGRDPLKERFAWRVWPRPDLQKMQDAAACLLGTHDFAAFGSPPHSGDSTIRVCYQARWQSDGWFGL
jgi:tRNA pseudouridine38-40 synthase